MVKDETYGTLSTLYEDIPWNYCKTRKYTWKKVIYEYHALLHFVPHLRYDSKAHPYFKRPCIIEL
jgi:hypothetical protein